MADARFTFVRLPLVRLWPRTVGDVDAEAELARQALPALGQLAGSVAFAPRRAPPPAPSSSEAELPAIVRRAQEQARCAHALHCLGYRKVRAEYVRHRQAGRDSFDALAYADLWPTMEFVRGWLGNERRRMLASISSTFLVAMLFTIIAGLAFAGVLAFLSWNS
jgi:hypothetical protein